MTVVDGSGNVDLGFSENIEASLTSGSGSLGGTVSIAPSNGVATFTNLAYTAASDGESFQITFDDAAGGSDLTLVTTAGTLSADVIATELVWTQQPSGAVNGSALSTQPIVTARDANSLTDTDFTDTVTLTTSGSGSLSNASLAASSGVATFTSFEYTATTDQESITFTADDAASGSGGALSSTTSSSITASAGPASKLSLTFDSSSIQADGSSTKSVTVNVEGATGLRRTTDNSTSVTLAVTGTGTGGGTQTVSSGQTSFTVTASTSVGTVNLAATSSGRTGVFKRRTYHRRQIPRPFQRPKIRMSRSLCRVMTTTVTASRSRFPRFPPTGHYTRPRMAQLEAAPFPPSPRQSRIRPAGSFMCPQRMATGTVTAISVTRPMTEVRHRLRQRLL